MKVVGRSLRERRECGGEDSRLGPTFAQIGPVRLCTASEDLSLRVALLRMRERWPELSFELFPRSLHTV